MSPVKRRRIIGKQGGLSPAPAEAGSCPSLALLDERSPAPVTELRLAAGTAPGVAADPVAVLEPLSADEKRRLSLLYFRWWRRLEDYRSRAPEEQLVLSAKFCLRALSPAQRRKRLADFATANPLWASQVCRWLGAWAEAKAKGPRSRAESVFLTWNGAWGDLGTVMALLARARVDDAPSLAPGASSSDAADDHPGTEASLRQAMEPIAEDDLDPEAHLCRLRALCEALRRLPEVKHVAAELGSLMTRLGNKLGVAMAAWGIEVCPRTFREQSAVRVHAHAFLSLRARVSLSPDSSWELLASAPHQSMQIGDSSFHRGRNAAAGLWYIQGPKTSALVSHGSHDPFSDYSVNPLWIMRALAGEKMLFAAARAVMARIPQNLAKNLENMDRWHRERCELRVATVMQARAERALRRQRPFKRFAMVEQWLAQYEDTLDRYRFLVLEGPSRLGKTAFVYSLAPASSIYEMSCSGETRPDLRAYNAIEHTILFFDECTPEMTVAMKKVFQAGSRPVTLNTSATNMFAIKVSLGGKRIVCAANDWTARLRKMPAEDSDWVLANSFHLRVTSPMFREELPAMASSADSAVSCL
jgi:hypothetical protein